MHLNKYVSQKMYTYISSLPVILEKFARARKAFICFSDGVKSQSRRKMEGHTRLQWEARDSA